MRPIGDRSCGRFFPHVEKKKKKKRLKTGKKTDPCVNMKKRKYSDPWT